MRTYAYEHKKGPKRGKVYFISSPGRQAVGHRGNDVIINDRSEIGAGAQVLIEANVSIEVVFEYIQKTKSGLKKPLVM